MCMILSILSTNGRLLGCLDGSVKIPLLDGTKPTIKELYDKYKNNPRNNGKDTINYVYSFDFNTNKFKVGELIRVFYTGPKKCYKITLDNGKEIICSAEHPFLTRSKHWRSLNTGLQVGDSLMPFRREYDPYEKLIVPEKDGTYSKQYTHKMVLEYKNGKLAKNKYYEGHHKDENKHNNDPTNLILCKKRLHNKYHTNKMWQDPEHNMSVSDKMCNYMKNNSNKAKEMSLIRWNKYKTKEQRKKHLTDIGCRNFTTEYNKFQHPNLLKIDPKEFIEYMKTCYSASQVIRHFNISKGGFYSYCKRFNINYKDYLIKLKGVGIISEHKLDLLNKLNSIYCEYNTLDFKFIKKLNKTTNYFSNATLKTIERYLANPKFIETVKNYNHKIKAIQYIGIRDTYDLTVRGDHNFALDVGVISKNSTGTGKSTVATYSLCYELYKLMCLKNPNRYYLGADETIWFLFFNLNLKLAEKTMWGKFQKALQKSPWFQERGTISGRTNLVYQPNKDIRLDIGSTEEHALSVAVMFAAMDEMSFGDNDNVDYLQAGMMQIYNQLYLRLSSRFLKGGRIQGRMYLISSAKSTNAVLESFIRDNEGQPGMHVSRYKQWEVLPASKFSGEWFKIAVGNELLTSYIMGVNPSEEEIKEAQEKGYTVIDVPKEMKHRFEMDFNRTLIDTCGISVQSSYKYIPYRIVEPCIGDMKNPFKDEIIKTGLNDSLQIKDFFYPEIVPEILYSKKIFIHCDLSKSGDMTGISAVAVLGYKNQERFDDTGDQTLLKEIVFRHVFSVGIQCPANDELSMIKVKDFIHYLKYDLGWNIAGVSCDGYQSLMLLQSLKLDGFNTKEVSMDIIKNKECVGYTIFRNTLVEQRIKLIKCHTLLKEITNLEKNETTGKIDHPKQTTKILDDGTKIKSVGKDISDSLGGTVYNATLSVDLNELDYMENVTIANNSDMTTISGSNNVADELFGFSQNFDGSISLNKDFNNSDNQDEDINTQIDEEINKTINQNRLVVNKIKQNNKTNLSDQEILDMYDELNNDGFIIM